MLFKNNSNSLTNIKKYIDRLHVISNKLSFISFGLFAITTLNMIISIYLWVTFKARDYSSFNENIYSLFFSLGAFGIIIVLSFYFDLLRKEGNSLFEFISDELQGITPSSKFDEENMANEILSDARWSLRQFTRSEEIPLFPGRMGPILIILLNFVFMIISLVLIR